jgi:hypothetical protein
MSVPINAEFAGVSTLCHTKNQVHPILQKLVNAHSHTHTHTDVCTHSVTPSPVCHTEGTLLYRHSQMHTKHIHMRLIKHTHTYTYAHTVSTHHQSATPSASYHTDTRKCTKTHVCAHTHTHNVTPFCRTKCTQMSPQGDSFMPYFSRMAVRVCMVT